MSAPDIDLDALGAYLASNGLAGRSGERALSVRRLSGGQSNPTYEVQAGDARFVLRKQPPGKLLPSAHAVDREYRVMKALRAQGVPVPEMKAYCEDRSVIGTPFYVMEFMDGRIFLDPALPGLEPAVRRRIYDEMNRTIATLHGVDVVAAGLSDYGKPGNYFERQIGRWSRQYRESATGTIEAMDALMDWLPAHIPPGDETCIVHGDYRIDNLVFDRDSEKVIGVLDWELSTLGHPIADFSYHCMAWHIPATLWRGLGGLDLASLGIPDEADYVAQYCRRTGRPEIPHWDFYIAYNLFRLAAILQGIMRRSLEGNANADNAVEMGQRAKPLAELGWEMAKRVRS